MYKVDIKNSGIKNTGASNTTILLGWKYGIFKANFAILIVLYIINEYGISGKEQTLLIYITALFIILGHHFPITMKIKGGKGAFVGVLLDFDWRIALASIGILLIFTIVTII